MTYDEISGLAPRGCPSLHSRTDGAGQHSDVWTDARLSPRDRSIATLAALTVLYRPEELPAHLRRARDNGLTNDEISALITHCAFYGGFPSAISTSMIAADTLL
jgi:4-carboxymuconolactone decarboxylase